MQALIDQDAFVIPGCFYRVSSFQKSDKIWIPAQSHTGMAGVTRTLTLNSFWLSLAIKPLREASKRKTAGFTRRY
jgi:hypothetical protein